MITCKIGFSQSSKQGRYYWCRLHACKKSKKRWNFEIKNLGEVQEAQVASNNVKNYYLTKMEQPGLLISSWSVRVIIFTF